jgi:hypothetical protein
MALLFTIHERCPPQSFPFVFPLRFVSQSAKNLFTRLPTMCLVGMFIALQRVFPSPSPKAYNLRSPLAGCDSLMGSLFHICSQCLILKHQNRPVIGRSKHSFQLWSPRSHTRLASSDAPSFLWKISFTGLNARKTRSSNGLWIVRYVHRLWWTRLWCCLVLIRFAVTISRRTNRA